MRQIVWAVALLAGWFVTTPPLAGDPLVVDLWPGKVPGDVGINRPETSRIHRSPLVGPTNQLTNVCRPTLTIYRPDQTRNTGTAMVICPGGGYWDLEVEGPAAWLNAQGMTGIILKYRFPRRPGEQETGDRKQRKQGRSQEETRTQLDLTACYVPPDRGDGPVGPSFGLAQNPHSDPGPMSVPN
jgi:hypothetical protein